MRVRLGSALFVALFAAVACAGCGKSGSGDYRPIEVLFFVSGPSGTQFQMAAEPQPDCGSDGTGIQDANGDHQFGDRVFHTPHLFVLENALQPVRGVFQVPPENQIGIGIDLFLGPSVEMATSGEIDPGACATVGTDTENTLEPVVTGPEIRVEVCAASDQSGASIPCAENTADPNIAFFATIGDIRGTNVTSCTLLPVAESCRTPATFFLENPKESVSAVFSKLGDQDRDAVLRAELYVSERLKDTQTSRQNVIVKSDI
jgi:hypothetical protein